MKILKLRVLNGPNYWSTSRQHLIAMKLDLQEMEDTPTNKIEGFSERLKEALPGLQEHHCSENVDGGFFMRVDSGTWMGHVVEHIALELQTAAGMYCGFGRTRGTDKIGVYNVIFSYEIPDAGIYAAKAAVRIAEAIAKGEKYDVEEDIDELCSIRDEYALGPSTASIVEEARKRGIPVTRLDKRSLVMLGTGKYQKKIRASMASTTDAIAVDIACNKEETKRLLDDAGVPVPKGSIVYSEEDLKYAIEDIGYPLVTKPVDGNHGRGASINISTFEDAVEGYHVASKVSPGVIVERFVEGRDFRFLVVDFKLVAVALRTPAHVKGDGYHTIGELIDIANDDPRRGSGHCNTLTRIKVDEHTLSLLEESGLTLSSVPAENEIVFLKRTANLSTGGTATDVTDEVHPYNRLMAERIARIVGLNICGIDVMARDISTPVSQNGGAVLEVNACPGLRMHLAPSEGLARNVAESIVSMLFPPLSPKRLPITAITGTNGKTTTTRLIAHMMKEMGHKVGYTTTDGIYIQDHLLQEGDCTGPKSTMFVLRDPTIDYAVLECARGGIIKSGLVFGQCDVGVVTNVGEDHIGLHDINTIEDLARLKSVVVESVTPEGYAVLNADDDLVYGMREDVVSNVALFSLECKNPRIQKHIEEGGIAAYVKNGNIMIAKGQWHMRIDKISHIPLTFGGKATFNIQNILAAVLACYVQNYSVEEIRAALRTFIPSPETTPGRMNVFKFKNFEIMVDYAHNPHSFRALSKFFEKLNGRHKVGIITGVGDRRDEDLITIGTLAGNIFDSVIVREDDDLRGRKENEIVNLVMQGLNQTRAKNVKVIRKQAEAIEYAVRNAKKGSFITVCVEDVKSAIEVVKKFKEEEESFLSLTDEILNYTDTKQFITKQS